MTFSVLARLGARHGAARRKRAVQGVPAVIGERIRKHLDTDLVIRTTVDEVHRTLRCRWTSIWVTGGGDTPRLAHAAGIRKAVPDPHEAPKMVRRAAKGRRTIHDAAGGNPLCDLAVPVVAPRSGLIGVLFLEGMECSPENEQFVEAVAYEAGFVLETANMYEQAVAGREKSEAILGRVADAIVVTDAKGAIREWNQASEGILGLRGTEVKGRGCAERLGLHVGERALDCGKGCPLLASAERDKTLGQEVWRLDRDGRRQPLLASVATVTDPDGAISEIVHSLRDITRLKEADEAKTLFLATASHELKTPLTVIQGFAQLLSASRYSNDTEREEALQAIERRAIQLNKIVDRMLLSSRIEAGQAQVLIENVPIAPLLTERGESLSATTGREILLEIEPGLPLAVADSDAVVTIVDHLLDNAVKYSPQGGPITVRASADETHVHIRVTDSGIGMDAQQLAHCFEKFWQAESTDVRRFGGTGIGLYIVRSLAEAMGGTVEATSVPGAGSTFTVSLPRVGAVHKQKPQPEGPPPGVGDRSVIREFMRQIGIPARSQP